MSAFKSKLVALWQPSPAKNVLLASCVVIWLLLGVLFAFYGYEATWRLWGISTFRPFFVDFRLLPGMVRSLHLGLDPTVSNPADPLGRLFNYPSVWFLLRYTNLSQSDTLWAGVTLLVLFFLGLVLFPGHLQLADVVILLLVSFSPAAMLLYERANVDLLIFFLCALAIAADSLSATSAAIIVGIASILKFYPFFGIMMFVSKGKRAFATILIVSTVLFAAYLALTFHDISRAWDTTNRGIDHSYGVQVAAMHFEHQVRFALIPFGLKDMDVIRSMLKAASYLLASGVLLLCLGLGILAGPREAVSSGRNLAAFWMGGAVYVGSFLLGNNWDYRLVFLLFTVPQLAQWMRDAGWRIISRLALILVTVSCWYTAYLKYLLPAVPDLAFALDQIAKWSLFAALSYLLATSVPDSMRSFGGLRPKLPLRAGRESPPATAICRAS